VDAAVQRAFWTDLRIDESLCMPLNVCSQTLYFSRNVEKDKYP
jgi:hypothetical protein